MQNFQSNKHRVVYMDKKEIWVWNESEKPTSNRNSRTYFTSDMLNNQPQSLHKNNDGITFTELL